MDLYSGSFFFQSSFFMGSQSALQADYVKGPDVVCDLDLAKHGIRRS